MGCTPSSNRKTPSNISQTLLFFEIYLFYPVYGTKQHIEEFIHTASSEYSHLSLEEFFITPFVRPLSAKISNLQLLSNYGHEYWNRKVLPPTIPTDPEQRAHFAMTTKLETNCEFISTRLIQIPFQSTPYTLPSSDDTSTPTSTKATLESKNTFDVNNKNENNSRVDVAEQKLSFLLFTPLHQHDPNQFYSTYYQHKHLDSPQFERLRTNVDQRHFWENMILPIHHGIHQQYPTLPINPSELYPTQPNQITIRNNVMRNIQLPFKYEQSIEYKIQSQLPRPHSIHFTFPRGEQLMPFLSHFQATFKPPTHMGTILIIDFTCQESINEFYNFLYVTYDYLLKGSILPLVDVDLHIIGINMHQIDQMLMQPPQVESYCTTMGFQSIRFHPILGQDDVLFGYEHLLFSQQEWIDFTTILWDKIFEQYFQWSKHLIELDNLDGKKITSPTIKSTIPKVNLPPGINNPLFADVLKHREWPTTTSKFVTYQFPTTSKVIDIFNKPINSDSIVELMNIHSLPQHDHQQDLNYRPTLTHASNLTTNIRFYNYLRLIEKYNSFELVRFSYNGNNTPTGQFQRYIPPTRTLSLKMPHIINHRSITIQNALAEHRRKQTNLFTILESAIKFDHLPIQPPQFIDMNSQAGDNDHNGQDKQQKQHYNGVPTQLQLDAFISIDLRFLISDPYQVLPIPCHNSKYNITNPNQNHLILPPCLREIATSIPQSTFSVRNNELNYGIANFAEKKGYFIIDEYMVDPILRDEFGIEALQLYSSSKNFSTPPVTQPQKIPKCLEQFIIKITPIENCNENQSNHQISCKTIIPGHDLIDFPHIFEPLISTSTSTVQQDEPTTSEQEIYHIQLLYKTIHNLYKTPWGTKAPLSTEFKHVQRFSHLEGGLDHWILPHHYSFGIHITPFIFLRQYWPLLLASQPTSDKVYIQTAFPTLFQHYEDPKQDILEQLQINPTPIPSIKCAHNPHPTLIYPPEQYDEEHFTMQDIIDPAALSPWGQFCDPSEIHQVYNILYADCPVHIVIFCVNPVIDKTRFELHNIGVDFVKDKFDTSVLDSNITVGLTAEPITEEEYQYFKHTIPKLYHREFILTTGALCAFVELDKLETQITFHFVAQHEWQTLFEEIQKDGVNQKIMLLRNNLPTIQ